MTRQHFLDKYNLSNRYTMRYYCTKFPEIKVGKHIDYSLLNKILEDRYKVLEQAKEICLELEPRDLQFLYPNNKNAHQVTHRFLNSLYYTRESRLINENTYHKCLKIIEKYKG